MKITAVDSENNLFRVESVFPEDMVAKVLSTPWLELQWKRQGGQENWQRRRILDEEIPWLDQWHAQFNQCWHEIAEQTGIEVQPYAGTAFWVDEPGFTCSMHTDGSLPGSLHLTWIGQDPDLGTAFYWYQDKKFLRFQTPMIPNSGYIMLHTPDPTYQKLLWHAMLTPVPQNTFRLTSYSWVYPK